MLVHCDGRWGQRFRVGVIDPGTESNIRLVISSFRSLCELYTYHEQEECGMREIIALLSVAVIATGSTQADIQDLEGGVLIAHHPTQMEFSSDPPDSGWCRCYWDSFSIEDCEDQVNRIDTTNQVIWFVLAAWDEEKRWCGTEFGLGEYDPAAFTITHYGPCWPIDGLEIPTSSWPAPNEGTAIVATGTAWQGNFIPVYWFAGYAYEEGLIPLATDPATDYAGTSNCANPPEAWEVESLGGMGFFREGVYTCPEGFLAGWQGYDPQGGGGIELEGGGGEAVIIRFESGAISFPQDEPDAPQYFEAPAGDAVCTMPSLEDLLADIGAESFATIAPGWRHMTPERSLDFHGNSVELVDFTDVYLVTLNGTMSVGDAIGELRGKPGIVYAERDGEVTVYEMPEAPSDPYYAEGYCGQWYLNNVADGECGDCVPDVDMNIPEAWAICYERDPPIKAGTKIGIMGTPVNETHEDLEEYFDYSLCGSFLAGEWDNNVESWGTGGASPHETPMAGLAGAGTDNGIGIASIANVPGSHDDDVLVVLVNDWFGAELHPIVAATNALDWICTYPLARGRIRVVNMSWGRLRWKYCHDLVGDEDCHGLTTFRDACRNAFRTGVNLIASAGNGENPPQGCIGPCCGGATDSSFSYPAAFPDYCLGVAAIGCEGEVHSAFHIGSYIDVAGPGVGRFRLGTAVGEYDSYGACGEGTSPASPVIASSVSLLLGAQSDLYPEDCNVLLKESSVPYGHATYEVGAGMPRLDVALDRVTGECRVFHGSAEGFTSIELEEGWSLEEPHPVMLKNIPPDICEVGNGEVWQELDLLAYRVTSVVQIAPPQGGSIEMVWPRGVGSSGWRLLDQTLDGHPDPEVPPYYDVNYYENWASLEDVAQNQYTFIGYVYEIILDGGSCWVPIDPATETYNLNYSYVVYDPNMYSGIEDLAAARSLNLTVESIPAQLGGQVRLAVSVPAPAEVWLGVYSVDGRLMHMFADGDRVETGRTDVTWDLTREGLRSVSAGAYYVRAKARFAGTGQLVRSARVVVVQ